MKVAFALCCSMCIGSTSLSAQTDSLYWAIPIERTGFTIMRSKPDTSATVVAKLTPDDVLLARNGEIHWCRAQDRSGHEGFLLRNEIHGLTSCSPFILARWIDSVFVRQRDLVNALNSTKDSTIALSIDAEMNLHEMAYDAALGIFSSTFCQTGDPDLLGRLLDTMWADRGSASEEPSYRLSQCFRCKPELVMAMLAKRSEEEIHSGIGNIEFGLSNQFDERDPVQKVELDRLLQFLAP